MILPIINSYTGKYNLGLSYKASAPFSLANKAYKNINVNSPDYIKYIYKLSKGMCKQTCEINVESGALQNLVKSTEPCIFIMNHTKKQSKDIDAAVFFNALLYREYIYHGLAQNCPRSKIMASQGFIKRAGDKGEHLKWLGLVPVSTKFWKRHNDNALVLNKIIQEFAEDQINLFLFPEGALAALTFLPLDFKFQPGVSSIIKKTLDKKPSVKVVPLGISHDKSISSIHIGEPVYFKRAEEGYLVSRGNADSKYFNKKLLKFYDNKNEVLITDCKKVLEDKDVIPYISGILAENLRSCYREAKSDLRSSEPKVYNI